MFGPWALRFSPGSLDLVPRFLVNLVLGSVDLVPKLGSWVLRFGPGSKTKIWVVGANSMTKIFLSHLMTIPHAAGNKAQISFEVLELNF